jgi:hypothetical protein
VEPASDNSSATSAADASGGGRNDTIPQAEIGDPDSISVLISYTLRI